MQAYWVPDVNLGRKKTWPAESLRFCAAQRCTAIAVFLFVLNVSVDAIINHVVTYAMLIIHVHQLSFRSQFCNLDAPDCNITAYAATSTYFHVHLNGR